MIQEREQYCFTTMTKKKIIANRCLQNGLIVEDIPKDLPDLTGLENSLNAKYLLFMKIKKVPKSGIEIKIVITVLVPVEASDIMNNIMLTLLYCLEP